MEETKKTLTMNDVVRFLILFAGFWIKEGLVLKSAKALVSAFGLTIRGMIYGPKEVMLTKRPVDERPWRMMPGKLLMLDRSLSICLNSTSNRSYNRLWMKW